MNLDRLQDLGNLFYNEVIKAAMAGTTRDFFVSSMATGV